MHVTEGDVLLSRGCQYGIRAVLYLAAQPDGRYVPIREISTQLDVSFHFLTKVLQALTAVGILRSYRGVHGGVALRQPAVEIRLIDVVRAIDGSAVFEECMLGLPECGRSDRCPLHGNVKDGRTCLHARFLETTFATLDRRVEQLRLSDDACQGKPDSPDGTHPTGRPPTSPQD